PQKAERPEDWESSEWENWAKINELISVGAGRGFQSACDMSGSCDYMVCTGLLRKSPPEKLRHYAWKK
ncbi:hypothetical protein A6R68_13669, partial [Neotoma lepida]